VVAIAEVKTQTGHAQAATILLYLQPVYARERLSQIDWEQVVAA
jgi:hypothetical protein